MAEIKLQIGSDQTEMVFPNVRSVTVPTASGGKMTYGLEAAEPGSPEALAKMGNLKYIIPVVQQVGPYKQSAYGLSAGTVTIHKTASESVVVNLAPPQYSSPSYWRAVNFSYGCRAISDEYTLFTYAALMSPITGGGTMGDFATPIGYYIRKTGTLETASFIPYIDLSSAYGFFNNQSYYGFILVYDYKYTGESTIIHENGYVESTLGITVL